MYVAVTNTASLYSVWTLFCEESCGYVCLNIILHLFLHVLSLCGYICLLLFLMNGSVKLVLPMPSSISRAFCMQAHNYHFCAFWFLDCMQMSLMYSLHHIHFLKCNHLILCINQVWAVVHGFVLLLTNCCKHMKFMHIITCIEMLTCKSCEYSRGRHVGVLFVYLAYMYIL